MLKLMFDAYYEYANEIIRNMDKWEEDYKYQDCENFVEFILMKQEQAGMLPPQNTRLIVTGKH